MYTGRAANANTQYTHVYLFSHVLCYLGVVLVLGYTPNLLDPPYHRQNYVALAKLLNDRALPQLRRLFSQFWAAGNSGAKWQNTSTQGAQFVSRFGSKLSPTDRTAMGAGDIRGMDAVRLSTNTTTPTRKTESLPSS